MTALIKEAGTKPELEVFDVGHIRIANHLINRGLVARPALFQLCLGNPCGIEATNENMVYIAQQFTRRRPMLRFRYWALTFHHGCFLHH